MAFPALKEAQGKLDAKRKELLDIFGEAGPEFDMSKVKSLTGDSAAKVAHIRNLNQEIDDLGDEVKGLTDMEAIAAKVRETHGRDERDAKGTESGSDHGVKGHDGAALPDLGDLFVKSQAYKGRAQRAEAGLDIDLKAVFQRSAGWEPESVRTGKLVDKVTTPIQVIDWIPGTATAQAAVVYMEETTYTNTAAETAEGGAYNEATLALAEKSVVVQKFTVSLPMTDEQLEDVSYARAYVNNRLPRMLRQRLDSQIINGNGTAPNIRGMLNTVGIQTQAKGGDVVPDAVYKAMVNVRVNGGAIPNVVFMNPIDWMNIRLLRTADGIYIWGSPSEAGTARLWGIPVTEAQVLTAGTALVADTSYTEFALRRGIDVQVTNTHADDFLNGKQRVRADMRGAFIVYRPAAIAQVTGL